MMRQMKYYGNRKFIFMNYSMQEVMYIAITLLNMFMQANFTGPDLKDDFPGIDSVYPFAWFKKSTDDQLKTLEIDGETPYSLMKYPLFLSCAHAILSVVNQLLQAKMNETPFSDLFLFSRFWFARVKGKSFLFPFMG